MVHLRCPGVPSIIERRKGKEGQSERDEKKCLSLAKGGGVTSERGEEIFFVATS